MFSFKDYKKLIKPWWQSAEKKVAWFGLLSLVILCIFSVTVSVSINAWYKDFYNSLETKNLDDFIKSMINFIPLLILLIISFCSKSYFVAWYAFRWRRWMTHNLIHGWMADKKFYKIAQNHEDADHPDQRIAQDCASIATGVVNLFTSFFGEGINFITFSIILWGLTNNLTVVLFNKTFVISGFLVLSAILYSLIGIFITFKIGRPLIFLERQQERCEADFRFRLMRVFERREEIATLDGAPFEQEKLNNSFINVSTNYMNILKRLIYINLYQNFHINANLLVPLFIVGPLYFKGVITLGILMQIQNIFSQVQSALSSIMTSYISIASLLASMQRIVTFKGKLQQVQNADLKTSDKIEIKDVILYTPDGKKIWDVPNFTLLKGQRLVLSSPSGTGKSSLMRCLAGLTGTQTLSIPENILFIPQRPYMPMGTLLDCVIYPQTDRTFFTHAEIIDAMTTCKLEHLIPFLDAEKEYQNILSQGEQQRINFVRVLLQKPQWLMMDEPTSSLNTDYKNELIATLFQHLPESGILLISHDVYAHNITSIAADDEKQEKP
ncbi:MAG: Inner membrane ABC transporter ATP-binding protein YddA [Holosporales bacterium]